MGGQTKAAVKTAENRDSVEIPSVASPVDNPSPEQSSLTTCSCFVLIFRMLSDHWSQNLRLDMCVRDQTGPTPISREAVGGFFRGARRPVSRVLSAGEPAGRSFLWDTHCCVPRATNPDDEAEEPPGPGAEAPVPVVPIRSCSRWGLPCRRRYRKRGALLPHRFALTCKVAALPPPPRAGGLFSVALSLGSPPPAVSRHRSSVEPGLSSIAREHAPKSALPCNSDRPAVWRPEPDGGR